MPRKPPVEAFRHAARLSILCLRAQRRRAAIAEMPLRPGPVVDADWFVRVFEGQRAIEEVAALCYRATISGSAVPRIEDGIIRDYAYVLGQTVVWRDGAPTPDHRRAHERAIGSFHDGIRQWRTLRAAHGLPVGYTREDTQKAVAALSPEQRAAVTQRLHVPHGCTP